MSLWSILQVHIKKRYQNEALKGLCRGLGSLRDPIHRRLCSNPPVAFNKIRVPKKACTLREQQLNEADRIRKVHNEPCGVPLISIHLVKYYHS